MHDITNQSENQKAKVELGSVSDFEQTLYVFHKSFKRAYLPKSLTVLGICAIISGSIVFVSIRCPFPISTLCHSLPLSLVSCSTILAYINLLKSLCKFLAEASRREGLFPDFPRRILELPLRVGSQFET